MSALFGIGEALLATPAGIPKRGPICFSMSSLVGFEECEAVKNILTFGNGNKVYQYQNGGVSRTSKVKSRVSTAHCSIQESIYV